MTKAKNDYRAFIASKTPRAVATGFAPLLPWPEMMKPFQRDIAQWACQRGRAAIFAGTGLGKTIQELAWAQQVFAHTRGRVLIFTPLAVAEQTCREAAKFGVDGVAYAADENAITGPIVVTNYERRDKFDLSSFAGIVLDESGILKHDDSKTRAELTEACCETPYLLCASATPAPNDWTELGQHAEFLGVMTAKEMLSMFFVHDGSVRAKAEEDWRLKRHAEADFWRWLASWSVMIRHPRDLGYDEPGYDLPALHMRQVTVAVEYKPTAGMLFPMEAQTMQERIRARKDSVSERVRAAVEIVGENHLATVLSATCSPLLQKNDASPNHESATPLIQKDVLPLKHRPSRAAGQRLGGNIKERITTPTRRSGARGPQNNKNDTMLHVENDMLVTQVSEKSLNRKRDPLLAEHHPKSDGVDLCSNSASLLLNMTHSSLPKKDAVQFAESLTKNDGIVVSTSTTVTQQGKSEVSYASDAIRVSDCSEMMPESLGQQQPISIIPDENAWVVWCNLNSEQDALEKRFGTLCFSVYGSLPSSEKVDRILRWLNGERPILLSKPSICGHGLNLQRCHNMVFVGLNDSFEQLFQAIRRCWRFGQTREVTAYLIASEIEGAVVANLMTKERKYERMATAMQGHMKDLCVAEIRKGRQSVSTYNPKIKMEVPTWLAA